MRRTLALSFLLLFVLLGCGGGEKKPEPATAEPTPEGIRAEAQKIRQIIQRAETASGAQELQQLAQQYQQAVSTFRQQYGSTPTGSQELQSIANDRVNAGQARFDRGKYGGAVGCCDAALLADPSSFRAVELKNRAQEELNKPKVRLKGFINMGETRELYAILEVNYPATRRKDTVNVRKGHVFGDENNFRLKRIIAPQQGVIINDTKTGKEQTLLLRP